MQSLVDVKRHPDKDIHTHTAPGIVLGCDLSGIVVKLGSNATGPVNIGDHVATFVMGGHWHDRGAFAEYVKAPADLVWIVPPGTLSHEEAATTGCACVDMDSAFRVLIPFLLAFGLQLKYESVVLMTQYANRWPRPYTIRPVSGLLSHHPRSMTKNGSSSMAVPVYIPI